jgi:Domain of unknown function (DUF5122) beta-propeller
VIRPARRLAHRFVRFATARAAARGFATARAAALESSGTHVVSWRSLLRRALAGGLLGLIGASAAAVGWTTTLPNGQVINIVEGSTATRAGFFLERRYPDGSRDVQFGTGGRVFFTMGSDNSPPTTLQTDAAGRLLVSGATPAADGRTVAAVLRFLPGGQVDATWGQQGRALAPPAAAADASAADVLPALDGSALVLGTIDDQQSQRAALWRLLPSGQPDTAFGPTGALVATALPESQGLSLQRSADGALIIALQTGRGEKTWLEVFRWRSGEPGPARIARQEFPEDWVGPAVLTPRGAGWVWLDASQPITPPLELTLVAPTLAWTDRAAPNAAVAVAPVPTEAASGSGHAALNPFSQDGPGASSIVDVILDDFAWPAGLALLLMVLGGAWWWARRE